jgi:hypothetical protein
MAHRRTHVGRNSQHREPVRNSDLSMPRGIRAPDFDSTTRYVCQSSFSRIEGWDWYYFSVDCPNVRYRSNPHSTNRIRNKTVQKRTVTLLCRVRKHCSCERQPRAVQLGTVTTREPDSSNPNQKHAQSRSASSQMLASASLPSVRDYERADPIGMMHMNRSDISELGVRKRR